MNVLILAAGLGTRTSSYSDLPKPLIEISGKSLLGWSYSSLHSLRASGLLKASDVFVVVSPELAKSSHLVEVSSSLGVSLITTGSATRGPAESALEGISQLFAKGLLGKNEPILISDCDHFIHPGEILRSVRKLNDSSEKTVMLLETKKDASDLSWCFISDSSGTYPGPKLVEKPQDSSGIDTSFGVIGLYGFSDAGSLNPLSATSSEEKEQVQTLTFMSDVVNWQLSTGSTLLLGRVGHFVPLGTEEQLTKATGEGLLAEGFKEYPTLFIDLDGTLISHDKGHFSETESFSSEMQLLDPMIPKYLSDLYDRGCELVITTSRPGKYEASVVTSLSRLGIRYDRLVMGITGGPRYLINDSKPSLISFPTATAVSLQRDSADVIRVLKQIEKDLGRAIVSQFPGESGSTTELVSNVVSGSRLIRKTSKPNQDSKDLIAYQADWYRHVGQLFPRAVPAILGARNFNLDSVASMDLEYIPNLVELGKKIRSESASRKEALVDEFSNLMVSLYSIHKSIDATPFSELGVILDMKVLPGIKNSFVQLGFQENERQLPISFNGKQVSNPYPFFKSLSSTNRERLEHFESSGKSHATLVHGDPTLSNIMVGPEGNVILLDPIGSRVSPGFKYNGFDLGRAHPVWDKSRIDLSIRLGYETWATAPEVKGDKESGFEISFTHDVDRAVSDVLDDMWKNWVPENEVLSQISLMFTLARILPYKVSAGKISEALVLLGKLGEIFDETGLTHKS